MVMIVEKDEALVELVDAARVLVDNTRQGQQCYYLWSPDVKSHKLGTRRDCALCQLAKALEVFDGSGS